MKLRFLTTALLSSALFALNPLPAQAALVASYSVSSAGFFGGGTVSGSFSGTFVPSAIGFPFTAAAGEINTAGVQSLSLSFGGNFALPDASWDLGELQSLRLVDDPIFSAGDPAPSGTPKIFELRAFDDESEVELLLRFAVTPVLGDFVFGSGAFFGAEVNHTASDTGLRQSAQLGIELIGSDGNVPPGNAVPEPASAALVLAGLALTRRLRRR